MRANKGFIGETLQKLLARPVGNNLLINSSFKLPINQRQVTSDTWVTGQYGLDRWRRYSNYGTISWGDGYLRMTEPKMVGKNNGCYIIQAIESPERYYGETVTFSAKVRATKGAMIGVAQFYNSDSENPVIATGDWQIIKSTFTVINDGEHQFVFCLWGGKRENGTWVELDFDITMDVEWVKAELGSVATPFQPRIYAEEIALCKRFYQHISTVASFRYSYGAKIGAYLYTFQPMRAVPKVVLKNASINTTSGGSNTVSSYDMEQSQVGLTYGLIRITWTSDYYNYASALIQVTLDAEL